MWPFRPISAAAVNHAWKAPHELRVGAIVVFTGRCAGNRSTWVDANRSTLQILDVREPAEFNGPLGHIPGAKLIPLGQLSGRLAELSRDQPIVAVCRSGARSAQATEILCSAGFIQVANLPGGMLRWR